MKILMVCLGNICRSPMAEGILRDKVIAQNLAIETDSCGTGNWHVGNSPDERGVKNLSLKGIDISDLRARQFSISDFKEFDLIYCMDTENYRNIVRLASSKKQEDKVLLILNEQAPNSNQSVPDPYYGGDEGFENVFQMLDEATDIIIEKYG